MRKINLQNRNRITLDDLKQVKDKLPTKMKKRIQAIMLVMQGMQAKQVAQFMGLTDHTVRRYVQNFNEGGLEELLQVKPKPGRTPKLTDEQKREISEIITKPPVEVGFGRQSIWCCKSIASYIKEKYGVEITDEGVRIMIRNMEERFSYSGSPFILKRKRGASVS